MIKYSKQVPYYAYKVYIMKMFTKATVVEDLKKRCSESFEMRVKPFDPHFEEVCKKLIKLAVTKVTTCGMYTIPAIEEKESQYMTDIYSFLSFRSAEEAQSQLYSTPYIENDYMFNLLELVFFALVIIDEEIERRFRTCYELWQNAIPVGFAGYSEKMHKVLPYYFTRYGNRIYLINPISGEVKFFERVGKLRGKKLKGLAVGQETSESGEVKTVAMALLEDGTYHTLAEITEFGGVKELHPTKKSGRDRKAKERERRREKGYHVEETPWLTTDLDTVDGSAYNIRTHSLIALMVYGLEVMKYGVMEANSIFTVDHINGEHSDNRIDNLQLLTRLSNEVKKKNPEGYYLDYFSYWTTQVEAGKKVQKDFEYRKNSIS